MAKNERSGVSAGEGGTIFSQLLFGIRKAYLSQDYSPSQVAASIAEHAGVEKDSVTHTYLNKVENGTIRLPKRFPFVDGAVKFFNYAITKDDDKRSVRWGTLLGHVYDVVEQDLTCNGKQADLAAMFKLTLQFNYTKVFVNRNSSLDRDHVKKLIGTESNSQRMLIIHSSRLPDIETKNRYVFAFDFTEPDSELQKYLFLDACSDFVLFGRQLLVLNFSLAPYYITDRTTIMAYRAAFVKLSERSKTPFW